MNNRLGWVRVAADDLSEFHRVLIRTIPKYASVAVSEMMLPANMGALPIEERALLPGVFGASVPEAARGEYLTNEQILEIAGVLPSSKDSVEMAPAAVDALVEELKSSDSFQEVLKRRVAKSKPVIYKCELRKQPWTIETDTIEGEEGEIKTLQLQLECYFRCEQLLARDSLDGRGTVLQQAFVGQRLQWPRGQVIPTCKTTDPTYEHKRFDTCHPAHFITLQVHFLKRCLFSATLKGQALV